MQTSRKTSFGTWLAFGPAAFSLLIATTAFAQSAGDAQRRISTAEATVMQAIARRDSGMLRKAISDLAPLIEAGLKRKKAGGQVSSCDLAAHSLGFAATALTEAITQRGEPRKLLMSDARDAAADFSKDMAACDVQAGQKIGNHAGVERALRAL
ncbi:hypothetical protein ACQ3G6_05980 [Allorhizobium undicola]|uniref:hypothetical protein n=1 Tax=Allorhizobium undicola TaxID=78527 RepID=UPI003D333B8E